MIALTGGGTGGHLAIVRALKKEFKKRGVKTVYIGSTKGQDREWFENDGDFAKRFFLKSQGVVDKRGLKKVKALKDMAALTLKARKILKSENIEAVVSVGGYSAAPAAFGALSLRIPLFIHEQNAHTGRLNALLKPFCKGFFSSFEPPFYPYPVDELFFKNQRIRKELKRVIFLGGSQGAKEINDLALDLAPKLAKRGIKIIHQTGKKDFIRIKEEYEKLGIEAEVFDFSKELVKKISQSDLAVSRAGASTLWELTCNAIPALYIPYPYAANDHQRKNALFVQQRGCAKIYEDGMDIFSLDLEEMSQNCLKLAKAKGAEILAEEILKSI